MLECMQFSPALKECKRVGTKERAPSDDTCSELVGYLIALPPPYVPRILLSSSISSVLQ